MKANRRRRSGTALCSYGRLGRTRWRHLHRSRRLWMRTRGTSPACSGAPWRTSWAAGGRRSWPRARRTAACASGALLRSRACCTIPCIGPMLWGVRTCIQYCSGHALDWQATMSAREHILGMLCNECGIGAAARFAQCGKGVWDAPRLTLLVPVKLLRRAARHAYGLQFSALCAHDHSLAGVVCAVRGVHVKPRQRLQTAASSA